MLFFNGAELAWLEQNPFIQPPGHPLRAYGVRESEREGIQLYVNSRNMKMHVLITYAENISESA